MTRKIFQILVLFALTAVYAEAQTPTPMPSPASPTVAQPAPSPANLDTILNGAEKQVINYQQTFKDLLAVETKTFEEFDKNGELDERTVVESNFFVYQSSKDTDSSSELRNIIKVNDKLIPDSQERANKFLAELEKVKTAEKELEKIQEESQRYDKTIEVYGFTLYEGIVLANNMRPYFDYKLVSTEDFSGRAVYVVSYQQTRKSPYITVNEKPSAEKKSRSADFDVSLPDDLKKADKFLRGKLWIDAETFQLWRDESQLVVQTAAPLVVQETIFEYAPSEFGILVPKKITFLDNKIKKISKTENFEAKKNARIVFDYSKFKKTNVDVQIIDEP